MQVEIHRDPLPGLELISVSNNVFISPCKVEVSIDQLQFLSKTNN